MCLYLLFMHLLDFLVQCFAWMSWAVLLLNTFYRGWIEGICGVNVFKLVFLLFEEESLKILTLDLHMLYRSLYTSSGTEGRWFGRVVFTGHRK